jgi:opacity protein-like surface antigen
MFKEKNMAWRKTLLFVFLFSIVGVSSAQAQHEFEVTPFAGSRFGGVVDIPSDTTIYQDGVDYYTIKSSLNYGIQADYSIWPQFQAEFMYNHQPTDLSQHLYTTDTKQFVTTADVDMYQWGFLFSLKPPERKLQPFIVGGLGFTHFNSGGFLPFSNRFSYNLGVGAKYFFSQHVGVRLEGRWSPTRTTTSPELVETFFGPEVIGATSHAEQGQANLGLIFRFK